jgi:hypothetical protein
VVDADPVTKKLSEVSSRDHVLDPYDMKGRVDKEREQGIVRKPLGKMLKDAISFKLPANVTNEQKIETEAEELEEEEIIEDEEEEMIDPQKKSPSKWTDEEWMILRDKIDAFAFADIWKMYKGDIPQPGEKPLPTKKKASKKKANQED